MKGRIFVALLTVLALNFAMIPSADAVPRAYVCTVSGVEIDLDGYVRISLTYEAAVGPRTRTHLAPTGHKSCLSWPAYGCNHGPTGARPVGSCWFRGYP